MNLSDWVNWSGDGPTAIRMEQYRQYVEVDDYLEILLVDQDNRGRGYYSVLFGGFAANPALAADGNTGERVQITVAGNEERLNDSVVAGRVVRTPVHDAQVLAGVPEEATGLVAATVVGSNTTTVDRPLIFNPGGLPNATAQKAAVTRANAKWVATDDEGQPVWRTAVIRLFEDDRREHTRATAVYWTLGEAVKYLLYLYNDELDVAAPDPEVIDAVFGDEPIMNVDLTGTRPLYSECLVKLLAGTRFSFTTSENRLVFWDKDRGRGVATMYLEGPGAAITTADYTNVTAVLLTRNTLAGFNEVTVAGDYRYYQAMFEFDSNDLDALTGGDLIMAWRYQTAGLGDYFAAGEFIAIGAENGGDAEKTEQFEKRHVVGGEDFNYGGMGYCFRKFALNERGDYGPEYGRFAGAARTGITNETATGYDFYAIFGHTNYQVRRRRFYQTIERLDNNQNEHFNPRLEVSFDSGISWQWMNEFRVCEQECGIVITANDLREVRQTVAGDDTATAATRTNWMAALYNKTLRLRLYACVADDTRMAATAAKQDNAASRFTKRYVAIDPESYKKRSLVAGSENLIGDGGVDERDDTAEAARAARQMRNVLQDGVLEGRPVVAGLALAFEPGMKVTTIGGRQISLMTSRVQAERYPTVVAVEFDLRGEHTTRLELDTQKRR